MALKTNALLTLAEARAALKLSSTDRDDDLEALITRASDWIETMTGRRLAPEQTYTSQRLSGGGQVRLWDESLQWPIISITSVSLSGTAQTVWSPGDADEPTESDIYFLGGDDPELRYRVHRWAGWPVGVGNISMTYKAGYGGVAVGSYAIPTDLKFLAETMCRVFHFVGDRQAEGVVSRSMAGESVTYSLDTVPRRAREILDAYRRWVL